MITKTYSFTKDGKQNDVYTLKNSAGYEVDIFTYGGRITRIWAPDKNGKFDDMGACQMLAQFMNEELKGKAQKLTIVADNNTVTLTEKK